MKLRNKKTGVIERVTMKASYSGGELQIRHYPDEDFEADSQFEEYHSLAELNEEWEDYKPAEPLIKDEKICKAVRAWWNIQENPFKCASVLCKSYAGISGNKDHDGYYNYCIYGYVHSCNVNKTATDFEFRTKTFFEYDRDKDYTLAELCGEEE